MIDILIILFILRSCYIGWRRGTLAQVFGSLSSAIIFIAALYFYQTTGQFSLHKVAVPSLLIKILSYTATVLLGMIICSAIGLIYFRIDGLSRFIKQEVVNPADKLLGVLIGGVKGSVWAAIIVFFFFMLPVKTLSTDIKDSLYASALLSAGSVMYEKTVCLLVNANDKTCGSLLSRIDKDKSVFEKRSPKTKG